MTTNIVYGKYHLRLVCSCGYHVRSSKVDPVGEYPPTENGNATRHAHAVILADAFLGLLDWIDRLPSEIAYKEFVESVDSAVNSPLLTATEVSREALAGATINGIRRVVSHFKAHGEVPLPF